MSGDRTLSSDLRSEGSVRRSERLDPLQGAAFGELAGFDLLGAAHGFPLVEDRQQAVHLGEVLLVVVEAAGPAHDRGEVAVQQGVAGGQEGVATGDVGVESSQVPGDALVGGIIGGVIGGALAAGGLGLLGASYLVFTYAASPTTPQVPAAQALSLANGMAVASFGVIAVGVIALAAGATSATLAVVQAE